MERSLHISFYFLSLHALEHFYFKLIRIYQKNSRTFLNTKIVGKEVLYSVSFQTLTISIFSFGRYFHNSK